MAVAVAAAAERAAAGSSARLAAAWMPVEEAVADAAWREVAVVRAAARVVGAVKVVVAAASVAADILARGTVQRARHNSLVARRAQSAA